MSFRDDNEEAANLRKPFLHTGSWYKMGSRQSSIMSSSAQMLRDGSVSVVFCVLVVALGPIQFGFTVFNSPYHCRQIEAHIASVYSIFFVLIFFFFLLQCGYSSPTQAQIISDLKLTISEV